MVYDANDFRKMLTLTLISAAHGSLSSLPSGACAPWLASSSMLPGGNFVESSFLWRAVVFRTQNTFFFLPQSGNTRLILLSNLGCNPRDGKKTKNFLPYLRNNLYIKCFSQQFEVYTNCFIQSENDMYNQVLDLSSNLQQR